MYDKFEYVCKNCRKEFYTKAMKEFAMKQPDLGITLKIDLQQHFETNSFTQDFDTQKGKVTVNLEDVSLDVGCPKCGKYNFYLLTEINPI